MNTPRTPPPIQLLPAFEASARLMSFKKAAEELCITPSAVSQQIKTLEDKLNLKLFERQTRRIELTPAGKLFFQIAEQTLAQYQTGFRVFSNEFSKPILRISMIPFVAYEMVIPALHEFKALQKDIELRIETSMSLVDFDAEPVDAAIRFGNGHWPNLEMHPLSPCRATLVASKSLLEQKPVQSLEDFHNHTLIYTRATQDDWQEVAKLLEVEEIPSQNKLIMDSYLAAMSAAEQGLGIGIAILPLTQTWLEQGRLVQIFPFEAPTPQNHYFVFRKQHRERAFLMEFYQWIKEKFEALERAK